MRTGTLWIPHATFSLKRSSKVIACEKVLCGSRVPCTHGALGPFWVTRPEGGARVSPGVGSVPRFWATAQVLSTWVRVPYFTSCGSCAEWPGCLASASADKTSGASRGHGHLADRDRSAPRATIWGYCGVRVCATSTGPGRDVHLLVQVYPRDYHHTFDWSRLPLVLHHNFWD